MNRTLVILFCAAMTTAAPVCSRGEGPPDALFSGGAFDGYTAAQLDTYVAPSNANWRFTGGSFGGYAFAPLDGFVAPPGLFARFIGGPFDGSAEVDAGPYPNPLNRDSNGDGLPDWWVAAYYHNVFGPPPDADLDQDGMTTWQEFLADTDPTDSRSRLEITGIRALPEGLRIDWKGGVWATQYLETRQSLGGTSTPWTAVATNLPPTATATNIIDAGATNGVLFYRIKAAR